MPRKTQLDNRTILLSQKFSVVRAHTAGSDSRWGLRLHILHRSAYCSGCSEDLFLAWDDSHNKELMCQLSFRTTS